MKRKKVIRYMRKEAKAAKKLIKVSRDPSFLKGVWSGLMLGIIVLEKKPKRKKEPKKPKPDELVELTQDCFGVGTKVCFHDPKMVTFPENGIVKEIPDHTKEHIRVVFKCNNEWDRYFDYTSELTHIGCLRIGWEEGA